MSSSKKQSQPSPLIPVITLLIIFVISTLAIYKHQQKFVTHQQKTPQSQANSNSNLAEIFSPSTFFYTKIFLNRDRTFISIPFSFNSGEINYPIWLYLMTQTDTPTVHTLAYHPQLDKLDWNVIKTDRLTLYQKQKNYASIEEFVASPPVSSTIVADPQVAIYNDFKDIKTTTLEDEIDLDTAEYIITTFKPLRIDDGFNYFETTIDATGALINDKNELTWQLRGSGASEETPFYIGSIHVDYKQDNL